MKIQILTTQDIQKEQYPSIVISDLGKPSSLDEFDVNIVDLGGEHLWKSRDYRTQTIDRIADLSSLRSMIMNRDRAIMVFLLPQDETFSYDRNRKKERLKDCDGLLKQILNSSLPSYCYIPEVYYEPTKTKLDEDIFSADFYFDQLLEAKTVSIASNKPTSVGTNNDIFLSTLDILGSEERIFCFLASILPKPEREKVPEWMHNVEFFDDHDQNKRIGENEQIIKNAQGEIEEAKAKLETNMYFKSILYTNGAELAEVVFSILEKLLACDLSAFIDEKKEDFLIKKSNYTIIGEIKGVTSNVKSEHISQVEVHYQGYMDKLAETGNQENVYQVLILNPFRTKPITEREPVHETQIKLAERNGCLIIETITLLKLFEKQEKGEIDAAYCENIFTTRTGLLLL